jgi:D-lyxose ketol-isomerase
MITRQTYQEIQQKSLNQIIQAGIAITESEIDRIEVADFGLSNISQEGVQILTLFDTDRISGKILTLLPNQTEPEHWHPPVANDPGKEEIVRAIRGELRFYLPGDDTMQKGFIPANKEACYTMRHEVELQPGEQLVLKPGTKHWFQAGSSGAVLYSFSTTVRDGLDKFTDPDIVRETRIID